MIYDLGCLDQPDLFPRIATALSGAAAALGIVAGLTIIGGFLNRSDRFQSYDIFAGWGLVSLVMTLSAVLFVKPLPFVTLLIFVMIGFMAIPAVKKKILVAPFWLLALFPGLFILTAINMAGVSKWDDFAEWVPNALYMFHNEGVPGHISAPSHSVSPSYPYALPYLTYMASWLVNGFLIQGGAMISFLMLIAFASMLAEMPPATQPKARALNGSAIAKTALALILVTIANPGFNASFTVTNQADAATMVLAGALGLMFWRMTQNPKARLDSPIELTAIAFVLLKQSNFVLLILLSAAFLATAIKNRHAKPAFIRILPIILPALFMHFIWQYYVNTHIKESELNLRPMSKWRFDLLGPLLQAMLAEMLKKSGLTILMLVTSIYGAVGLFRPSTAMRNFSLMVGIIYGGYLVFLTIAYLSAGFSESEIRRAASFYRYSTHTALLGVSALWMAAPAIWKAVKLKLHRPLMFDKAFRLIKERPVPFAVLLVISLPLIILIHAPWIVPQTDAQICSLRKLGHKLSEILPDHSGLVVLEPETAGLLTYITDFEFALAESDNKSLKVEWFVDQYKYGFDRNKLPEYEKRLDGDPGATALLVPKALHEPLEIKGYDNSRENLLLESSENGWKRLSFP